MIKFHNCLIVLTECSLSVTTDALMLVFLSDWRLRRVISLYSFRCTLGPFMLRNMSHGSDVQYFNQSPVNCLLNRCTNSVCTASFTANKWVLAGCFRAILTATFVYSTYWLMGEMAQEGIFQNDSWTWALSLILVVHEVTNLSKVLPFHEPQGKQSVR